MENNLHIDFKPQEDISDTLSSSAASASYFPYEESSPAHAHSTNSLESESMSRKIRKKRDAYRKIDDETRLHLLEAVQRGETLKSAAKRYNVNYSSAKSIFHIFRKEGRILKKATQENNLLMGTSGPEAEIPHQFIPNQTPQIPMRPFYQAPMQVPMQIPQQFQPLDFRQDHLANNINNVNEGSGCSSPLNGLVDNFADLLKIGVGGVNSKPAEDVMRPKNFMPIHPSRFMPKVTSPTNSFQKMMQSNQQMMQPNQQMNQQMNHHINLQMAQQMNPQINPQVTHQINLSSKPPAMSPAEKIRDFYMNYSNSPLSGNRGTGNKGIVRKGSGSNNNTGNFAQGEYDSFSDMVSAFQSKKNLKKMSGEEEIGWNGNIENAAIDTYKSFMDAQMVLSNAFMKASMLNNLVQMQKTKVDASPKFLPFHGN